MDARRLGGGASRSFRWDEPQERPGVLGRTFARAGTAALAVFALLLVFARVIPFFHGAVFFVAQVLVFGAAAFVVLLDRRSVTIDDRGVTIAEFLGRLPSRTIPFRKIGRAEIEATGPVLGKSRRIRRPGQPTLHISAPDRNGRSGIDLLAVSLADGVDRQALLDEFRRYGVDADLSEESRPRRSAIPAPIALVVFPIGIALTAYWSATRPQAEPIFRPVTIACATLNPGAMVDLRVDNVVTVSSITLAGFSAKEPDVSVGPVSVVPPARDSRKTGETMLSFRAVGLVPKQLYALTVNTPSGPSMVPFLAVPGRHQGMGC